MHPATEPPPAQTPLKTLSKTAPIPLDLSLSWSRASRAHLPDPKMAPRLKTAIQTAFQTTLQMAPPLYPALKKLPVESLKRGYAIDFSMVDDPKIHALNRDYRGKDQPTDVLSFPLWEDDDGFPMPDDGAPIALGDIVISTQTAARQAAEQNHSFEREITFLTIHGALHLLGYDHGKDHARRQMFSRQDAIFEAVFNRG